MFQKTARVIGGFVVAAVTLLAAAPAVMAMDGYVVSIQHNHKPEGGIHDGSTPGKLLRYDVADGKVTKTRTLVEQDVTEAYIGPFGDRVVICRADGTLAIVPADGGQPTEIGRFIAADKMKKGSPASTGVQWPATDGGRWIYYTNRERELVRIDLESLKHEPVVKFNRDAAGEFALSPDATPESGYFAKRTDNYAVVLYPMANGDGDLYSVPVWAPGCGISISPDGSMIAANDGTHTKVALVDMNARRQHEFRISQWDGDPTQGIRERSKLGRAWQHFRWSANAMEWIAVKQARLVGESTHEINYSDAMLYNWVEKRQINITNNKDGTFDRPCGVWVDQKGEQLIGYYRGEAPYTIELGDNRLEGDGWAWDFGDGATAKSAGEAEHTYQSDGVYNVTAQRGQDKFRAQVTVEPRRAPEATVQFVNPTLLLAEFDEPVSGEGTARLSDGGSARSELNVSGRQLRITLDKPIGAGAELVLEGFADRAQQPNPLPAEPMKVVRPDWPTNYDGAIYAWASADQANLVYDAKQDLIRSSRLRGNFDRNGWLELKGGRAGTGFFGQANSGQDLHAVLENQQLTLEAMIEPQALSQAAGREGFPRRIINLSAWHDGSWTFLLGQSGEQLVTSVRTADNFLNMSGEPVKEAHHGRAPVYEIHKLTDTDPHHVVVTYEPGRLLAYVDGEKVFESTEVTGNIKMGFGELVFGGNHNGGRHEWRGRMRNIGIYGRVLPADEVRANYAAISEAIKPLPRLAVRAKVLAVSSTPTAEAIAPYTEALVVNEYEVEQVTQQGDDWAGPKVTPGQVIRVYQWGLVQKEPTKVADLKPGDVRELTLEAYADHPGNLDEVVTSHELDLDGDHPALYEPR